MRHMGFHDVEVFDADAAPDGPGHALEITANASRVLHALKLQERLEAHATTPTFTYTRGGSSGFVLIQRPLGAFSTARYGAPDYVVDHAVLLRELAAACAERNVTVRYGHGISAADPAAGTLQHANGETTSHQVILAADGRGSSLRRAVSAGELTERAGPCVISATTRTTGRNEAIQVWLGDRGYCVQYPLPGQRIDLLVVTDSMSAATPEAGLSEVIGNLNKPVDALLENVSRATFVNGQDIQPAEHWHAGRLALLGDACHPMAAHSTQGACLAIEDAWLLGVMMERWEDTPHESFSEYERYRAPRARRMRRETLERTRLYLDRDRVSTLKRNLGWSLTSRFLPEISMARLDWLYGYDCIKGFS